MTARREARSAWPRVAAAEDAVIGSAGSRCECRGLCGRPHAAGGGRCDVFHRLGRPLYVVPANPETRIDSRADVIGPRRAMCGPCWDLAHKVATNQAAADRLAAMPCLFDGLDGAA